MQHQLLLVLLLAATAAASAAAVAPQQPQPGATATALADSTTLQQLRQPSPPVWPQRFRATLFQNRTGRLALTTLWYDWRGVHGNGANLNIIASQLGGTVYDLEFNNGTSFIFSRDEPLCKTLTFDVGILYPNWLANASYLGQTSTDTFVTDVWTKGPDFIRYYADAATGRPVRWTFLWSGAEFHVLAFDEHALPPRGLWQAPAYCFNGNGSSSAGDDSPLLQQANGRMLRLLAARQQVAAAAAQRVQQVVQRMQQQPGVQTS